jgi:hypothetical protein
VWAWIMQAGREKWPNRGSYQIGLSHLASHQPHEQPVAPTAVTRLGFRVRALVALSCCVFTDYVPHVCIVALLLPRVVFFCLGPVSPHNMPRSRVHRFPVFCCDMWQAACISRSGAKLLRTGFAPTIIHNPGHSRLNPFAHPTSSNPFLQHTSLPHSPPLQPTPSPRPHPPPGIPSPPSPHAYRRLQQAHASHDRPLCLH